MLSPAKLTPREARACIGLLNKAARKLAFGDHWIKGDYEDGLGNYCLSGAIISVSQEDSRIAHGTTANLEACIERCIPDGRSSILEFNDAQHTDWPDIAALIRKVRASLRADAQRGRNAP